MFGQIDIRSIRKSQGLTQSQLGVLCGMGKSQISRMESGELGSRDTLIRVLDAMGYQLVIEARPKRKEKTGEKDRILHQLSLYKRYNAQKYGIEAIGLFGSFARGDQREGSDIDIVLRLTQPSLYKLVGIQSDLQCLFKRDVDLVTTSSRMTESFKEQMEKDAVYV